MPGEHRSIVDLSSLLASRYIIHEMLKGDLEALGREKCFVAALHRPQRREEQKGFKKNSSWKKVLHT